MAMRRKQLFAALARNAVSPAVYYRLPHDQVVSLGVFKFQPVMASVCRRRSRKPIPVGRPQAQM
jgi:hypothetical protein